MVGGFRLRQQAVAAERLRGRRCSGDPCAGGQAAGALLAGPQPPLPLGLHPHKGCHCPDLCPWDCLQLGLFPPSGAVRLNGRMRLRPIILSYPFSDWLAVRAEGLGDRGGVFLPYTGCLGSVLGGQTQEAEPGNLPSGQHSTPIPREAESPQNLEPD